MGVARGRPLVLHMSVVGEEDRPFLLAEFLAAVSAREQLGPERVVIHHATLPYGHYWSLLRPLVELRPHSEDGEPLRAAVRRAAAHEGGALIPLDRLWVAPPPPEACADAPTIVEGPWMLRPERPVARVSESWIRRGLTPYARAALGLLPSPGALEAATVAGGR